MSKEPIIKVTDDSEVSSVANFFDNWRRIIHDEEVTVDRPDLYPTGTSFATAVSRNVPLTNVSSAVHVALHGKSVDNSFNALFMDYIEMRGIKDPYEFLNKASNTFIVQARRGGRRSLTERMQRDVVANLIKG